MAELTKEELQKQLAEATKKNGELAKERDELKASVEAAEAAGTPSPLVKGSVAITLESPDGEKTRKKVGFRNGRKKVRLANGNIVDSEAFLKVCNGKTLTAAELENSHLRGVSKEDALAHLTNLATMGASMIVEK
jgi:multidrug resistance efflux pump